MVALDAYRDNLCLWRCIAVHRGARPDRSTKEARSLAKSFYKLKTVPQDFPTTSLDELDKVEGYINKGVVFSFWLAMRVYEPERKEDGEVVWHHRRSPSAKLANILTIGVYEGHAFVIKDIAKLTKIYVCSLQPEIHKNKQSSSPRPNLQPRKNGNRMPRGKGKTADSNVWAWWRALD